MTDILPTKYVLMYIEQGSKDIHVIHTSSSIDELKLLFKENNWEKKSYPNVQEFWQLLIPQLIENRIVFDEYRIYTTGDI